MPLGLNKFSDAGNGLLQIFNAHSIWVQVAPSEAAINVPRDKYFHPLQPAPTKSIRILVVRAEDTIKAEEGGGVPVEQLQFYALPGTIQENDEVTWNGHSYRTSTVWPFGLGGFTQLVYVQATREVDAS